VPKVHHKPIKRPRKGSNKESKRQPKGTLVWRTGLSSAPGHSKLNSLPSRKSEGAPLYFTGLSGVPAEQRLLRTQRSTATAFNVPQCAQRSEHARVAHRTVYRTYPVHHRTAQRPHKSELQRSNPNSWLTWLAHRTVSGGAPDCLVRHATAVFQRPFLVVGAINTPTTPHSMASKFSTFNTLQEL
jgi:hypothetical protein